MNNLALEGRPELAGEFMGATAQQPRQLGGVVVDQSPGNGATGGFAAVNGLPLTELTLDTEDSRT